MTARLGTVVPIRASRRRSYGIQCAGVGVAPCAAVGRDGSVPGQSPAPPRPVNGVAPATMAPVARMAADSTTNSPSGV